MFQAIPLFLYFYHFFWAVSAVERFCDVSRYFGCAGEKPLIKNVQPYTLAKDDPIMKAREAIFDTPLLLCAIWHMIEWIRWTIFLMSILMEKNMLPLFNLLCLNIIFGYVATIYAIVARFSATGAGCVSTGA